MKKMLPMLLANAVSRSYAPPSVAPPMKKMLSMLLAGLIATAPGLAHGQDRDQPDDQKPLWSQADQYFDAIEMAEARAHTLHKHGDMPVWIVMADRLETEFRDDEETLVWDAQGYYGGDIDKLYIKGEGEYSFTENEIDHAELQALWSHALRPYWDIQAGIRYDFKPRGLAQAVFGIQGLAPYLFEVDTAVFVSENGNLTARMEVEYELLLTQRLILQPRIEAHFSAQRIPERELGAGLADLHAGLRLRYEIKREVAPYIGVEWRKSFGQTADFMEARSGNSGFASVVLGVRAWF